VTLYENNYRESFSILKLLKLSFEWSVKYYLILTVIALLATLSILVIAALAERFKVIQALLCKK
jgi:hypothetical protein